MRTVRTKVYQFNELNENAKENAINSNSEINVDYDWWENVYYDAEIIGLKITSFRLDRNRNASGEFLTTAYDVCNSILENHGVECATYETANKFKGIESEFLRKCKIENDGDEDTTYEQDCEYSDLEEDFLNELLEDYSVMLQSECEYLQSDEAISETLIANEYEFTKEGNRF